MQAERLIARIRGQLELGTPDLEARSLAGEYAALCVRARERLEQCATLVRGGNEHAAFQAAEAEPDLLGLCALLSFAESDRWHALCRERGLPAGFPLDGQHVLAVESLYGRVIGESHPLYRDYRDAIRRRDEDRALAVLRSIVRINPDDPNAQSELARLSAKFLRESLGRVGALFTEGRPAEAVELMQRMERFGANDLAGEPRWDDARARRAAWLRANAAEQAVGLVAEAALARDGGHWEACAAALGRTRALERDHQLNLAPEVLARMAELEAWAGELAATAEAEAALRAAVESLLEEWQVLGQEAARGSSPAILIVRLSAWLERASPHEERLPEGLLREARALRQATRTRLNRRYLLLTSSWVVGLLVIVGAVVAVNLQRQQEEETLGRFSEAARLVELYEHDAALRALDEFERGGAGAAAQARRKAAARPRRAPLAAQMALEQKLRLEARQLAETGKSGVNDDNVAEVARRSAAYLRSLGEVGPALRERLKSALPDPEGLAAASQNHLGRLRQELAVRTAELNKAVGDVAAIAEPARTMETLERLRRLLKTLGEAGDRDLDSAAAAADRGEIRLAGDRKIAAALRGLEAAADLTTYLAALADASANTAGEKTDLGARASFVFTRAPTLQALPRPVLAPRVAAMWDAAATADPQGVFHPAVLTDAEQRLLRRLSDTSLADGLRRATLSLYSVRGVTPGRQVYVVGEIVETKNAFTDGVEFTQKAKELGRDGSVTEGAWRRREFNNGFRNGEELTSLAPIPELEFIRQVTRFQDARSGRLLEPPLRTMERVRRSDSPYPELRAFQLQELYKLAGGRPDAWGLIFSPSAQRDAENLRRITQNALEPYDYLFRDKWADVKGELRAFLLPQAGAGYAEEARFWRATFAQLRTRRLVFAGMVGRDGAPRLREAAKGSALYGLDNDGKVAVLFRVGEDGLPKRVADAAPLSPLLRYPGTVAEAAEAAGIPKGLNPPDGGWETLLQGRDL
ncbi:MAG: hypothetical protein ACO34G_03000 [Opitutales bacterium]